MISSREPSHHSPVTATEDIIIAKENLRTHGYCIIANAMSPEDTLKTRLRLEEQANSEREADLAFRDGGPGQETLDNQGKFKNKGFSHGEGGVNQRVFMLVNKGACFRESVEHPLVDELIGHLLGEDFLLSTLSANIAVKGGVRMGLHTDQWWMPQPTTHKKLNLPAGNITRDAAPGFIEPDESLGIAPPVCATAVWVLSEFSPSNGATELVPGSHLSGAYPRKTDQHEYPIVQATASAGSLIVFDGRLWHGTGANHSGPDRMAVLGTYCAPQFRQQENWALGLDPNLWPEMSDKLKQRLGFKVWNGYGRIEKQFAGYVGLTNEIVGELNLKQ